MKRLSKGDRERILGVLEEGKGSEYWYYLRTQIEEWIKYEQSYVRSFEVKGMKDEELESYNRAIEKMDCMAKFLNINDILIKHNRTILDGMSDFIGESYKKVESFLTAKVN